MMKKRIQMVMAIAIISISLVFVNPVKAYVYYSEAGGTASATTEWGIPLALVGEYTSHVLKLGVKGLDCASATSKGSMYVYGVATSSGWVTGTLKWYMRGTLVAPFLGVIGIIDDAWITVKFEAIDLTASASVENVLLHEHADPITGTQFDGEYDGTMDIPLYDGHVYKFVFDVEVHAEVLGVIAVTVADFGGVFWSDSQIEWRYMDVPNIDIVDPPQYTLSISVNNAEGGTVDPAPGNHTYDYGEVETVTAYPNLEYGWWFNCWYLDGQKKLGEDVSWYNQITVTMDSDHTLQAYFSYGTPGGGGSEPCPTLFTWNGTSYIREGTLDIHAHSDIILQHRMMHGLSVFTYKLQLKEMDNFTSHIDHVRLYAVSESGQWRLCPLRYAYHSELGLTTVTVMFNDNKRVDLNPAETLDMCFLYSTGNPAYFVFEISGYNMKMP